MEDIYLFGLQIMLAASKNKGYRERAILCFKTLVNFLQCNNLTQRIILPENTEPNPDAVIRKSDLTELGFTFYVQAVPKWLAAQDRGTAPSDDTLLKKSLDRLLSSPKL